MDYVKGKRKNLKKIPKNGMMKYVKATGSYEPMNITEQRSATKSREQMKKDWGSKRNTMKNKLAK